MGIRSVLQFEYKALSGGLALFAIRTTTVYLKLTRLEIEHARTVESTAQPGPVNRTRIEIATRDAAGSFTTTAQAPTVMSPINGPVSRLAGSSNVLVTNDSSGIISSTDSGGTYTSLMSFNFNDMSGLLWKPDPDEVIHIVPTTILVVRALISTSDLAGWCGKLYMEES